MNVMTLVQQPADKLPGGGQLADGFSLSPLAHDGEAGEEDEEVSREKMRGGGSGEHQGSQGCS